MRWRLVRVGMRRRRRNRRGIDGRCRLRVELLHHIHVRRPRRSLRWAETPQSSVPSSPTLPPNPPFTNQSRASLMARPGHASSKSTPGQIPTPTSTITTYLCCGGAGSLLALRPTSPRVSMPNTVVFVAAHGKRHVVVERWRW